MFYLCSLIIVAGIFVISAAKGGRQGLWYGWLLALAAMPIWITFTFGSLTLDMRSIACVVGVAAIFIFKEPGAEDKPPLRLHGLTLITDIAVVVLFLVQVYSQYRINRFGPLTAPDIARRWVLPYVVGRVYFGSVSDIRKSLPVTAKMLMGLSVMAVFEAVTKFHVVNKVLGKTYPILETGEGYRWGLKRAQGPLDHPIFFGMMLVLLYPFAFETFREVRAGRGPKWWRLLLPTLSAAVIVTVSRGAQISLMFTGLVTFFFQKPKWRTVIFLFVVVGGAAGYGAKAALTEFLGKLADESEDDIRLIMINGEEYEYTGTKHRQLLFVAYADAFTNCDAFGYGFEMQGIELEEPVAQRFSSIDNHFIKFFLQYGHIGLSCFIIQAILSLINLGIVAWDVRNPAASMAGAMFGALISVTFGLLSVWFAPDFGTVWLFCVGLAGNLRSLPVEAPTPAEGSTANVETNVLSSPRKVRLVPAHAPIRNLPIT